jgi:hypothetical protein
VEVSSSPEPLGQTDYQEKLTMDRKGHKENQDELGTEVSKEDKANLGT